MSKDFVTCFHCGKQVPRHMEKSTPTWYGSYSRDQLVQAVCVECYAKGVRTDIGKKIDKQRASQ